MAYMRVLLINEVCGHTSTGRICGEIADELSGKGHEVKIAYGRSSYVPAEYQKYGIRIGNDWTVRVHALQTRLFDAHGFGSKRATKKFLEWTDEYDPDLVWLHNLHGYYINIELLFLWIKSRPQMKVQWTLHDCWAFTGHCVHFTMAKCDKWKESCQNCPQKREYPASRWMDRSEGNYLKKKELFCGIKDMRIITPSQWLANLVGQSFMKEYPVEVRHNRIDEAVFRPTKSDFREKHGLNNKTIILGVASIWERRKGLDDFLELAQMLDDRYVIILVGLEKKRIKELQKRSLKINGTNNIKELEGVNEKLNAEKPLASEEIRGEKILRLKSNGRGVAIPESIECLYEEIVGEKWSKSEKHGIAAIYCLPKTKSKEKLAAIYSAADYYVNPTHEDNFPTTNLEAAACGTRVITYDVGGCRETLHPNYS